MPSTLPPPTRHPLIASTTALVAVVAIVVGALTLDATAAVPPLPESVTLALQARDIDCSTVEIGDGTAMDLPATADDAFEDVRVDLPVAEVQSGRVDIDLLSGGCADDGAPTGDAGDDFQVVDVRLLLADGTEVRDERYDPYRAYTVGNGITVAEEPRDIIPALTNSEDSQGTSMPDRLARQAEAEIGRVTGENGDLRPADPAIDAAGRQPTPEVMRREFRFVIPVVGRTSADAPARPTVTDGTVAVAGGSGELTVDLLPATLLPVVAAQAGNGHSKPFITNPGRTTVSLADITDLGAVAGSDDQRLVTELPTGFATQTFQVAVDEETAATTTHLDVVWEGRTAPGRGATLYAFDQVLQVWTELASATDASSDVTLEGRVDIASMVGEDGVVRLQVQEQKFSRDESDFTIAWLTDTQFLPERFPDVYDAMTQGIVDLAEDENIVYAMHTGDITQNYNAYEYEWVNASGSMQVLEDAGIPYGVVTGNHDLGTSRTDAAEGSHVYYDEYFPRSRFLGMDRGFDLDDDGGTDLRVQQGSSYDADRHGGDRNRNHYDLIETDGLKLMVLYMDEAPNPANDPDEYRWANEVIAAHPDHFVIVAVHHLINSSGNYSRYGQAIAESLVMPNDNVRMVVAGHHIGAAYNVLRYPTADGGERVAFEILHDYQGGPEGGSGYLRLMRFDLDEMQMDQQPYSPYTDDFDYGADVRGMPERHDDYTLSLDYVRPRDGVPGSRVETDLLALAARTGTSARSATADANGVVTFDDRPAAWVARVTDAAGEVAESAVIVD